jgi:hypothetical protein
VEKLPEISVGLEDAGALASLHPFFELQDDALKQRRQQERRDNLSDLKDDVAHCQGMTFRLPNRPDRSHQPRGRLIGELHRLFAGWPWPCMMSRGYPRDIVRAHSSAVLFNSRATASRHVLIAGPCFSTRLVVRESAGDGVPPETAERLMTPAAVLIAVGGLTNPPHRWVFVCLGVLVEALQPFASRFRALAAADCNGRPRGKPPFSTRTLWEGG